MSTHEVVLGTWGSLKILLKLSIILLPFGKFRRTKLREQAVEIRFSQAKCQYIYYKNLRLSINGLIRIISAQENQIYLQPNLEIGKGLPADLYNIIRFEKLR